MVPPPLAQPVRPGTLYLPIVQLIVPQMWRVGRVTFRPPGWVTRHTGGQAAPDGSAMADFLGWARENLGRDKRWSTASVRVRWPEKAKDQAPVMAAARNTIRDAVAVLLLYQHALFPRLSTDTQQFGLRTEMGSELESYAILDGRRIIATGSRVLGVMGDWDFSPDHVRRFGADPRFAYLDGALRTPPKARTEFQGRFVTAVRTRALGTPMQREQMQVVVLATAVEALLGADARDAGRGEFHRIARRGAYLYCGARGSLPRYPTRPACELLKTTTIRAMNNLLDQRTRDHGRAYGCSWFAQVYDLLGDRNEALHGQREQFGRQRMNWHEIATDHMILNALEWVVARGATDLDELDDELDAFVKGQPVRSGYPNITSSSE